MPSAIFDQFDVKVKYELLPLKSIHLNSSFEGVLLVAIATIPAFLVAWFFMKKWLETFAYHTGMNVGLFAAAFLLVVILTLLTTGYHVLKAAASNPVKSLRSE